MIRGKVAVREIARECQEPFDVLSVYVEVERISFGAVEA